MLTLSRLEHSQLEIPKAHPSISGLRKPLRCDNSLQLVSRFLRRNCKCQLRSLQTNMHVLM